MKVGCCKCRRIATVVLLGALLAGCAVLAIAMVRGAAKQKCVEPSTAQDHGQNVARQQRPYVYKGVIEDYGLYEGNDTGTYVRGDVARRGSAVFDSTRGDTQRFGANVAEASASDREQSQTQRQAEFRRRMEKVFEKKGKK